MFQNHSHKLQINPNLKAPRELEKELVAYENTIS